MEVDWLMKPMVNSIIQSISMLLKGSYSCLVHVSFPLIFIPLSSEFLGELLRFKNASNETSVPKTFISVSVYVLQS